MRRYLVMFVLGCGSSAPVQQSTEPAPAAARPIDPAPATVRGALVPPGGEIHLVGIQQKTDRFNALQIPASPSSAGYGSRGGAGGVVGRPPPRIRIAAYAKR